MMLPPMMDVLNPPALQAANAGLLGTTQITNLPRVRPLEELEIILSVTFGATGPTWLTTTGVTTPAQRNNLLGLLTNVNLQVMEGESPRTVVNCSGMGLLEYAALSGCNLDTATWEAVAISQFCATGANNQKVRITYRIPIVHPFIGEPLRTRCLLPCHRYSQDPILTLTFAPATDMYSAGSISAVTCEVVLRQRVNDPALDAAIDKSGGYLRGDLLETAYNIATGTSGEQKFPILLPGRYLSLFVRQYLGGSSVTRDVLDQTTTFGLEQKWKIESNQSTKTNFRWKMLQIINDRYRAQGMNPSTFVNTALFAAASSAGAVTTQLAAQLIGQPNFGGGPASGTSYRPAASVLLDFLSENEAANELGSTLDCNTPQFQGQKMELIGNVASVATNGSTMFIGGHRLLSDLSPWIKVAA